MTIGTITFNGTDAKFTYRIDYMSFDGEYKSAYFVKNSNDYTMNINISIDIG